MICAVVSKSLDEQSTVVQLRSDHISAEEGTFISDTLLSGRMLLLIASETSKELPAKLAESWEEFCDDPQGPPRKAGNNIHFRKQDTDCKLGTLGLILSKNYAGRCPHYIPRFSINKSTELCSFSQPLQKVHSFGRNQYRCL